MTESALELRDVTGPSALGGGRRRTLELLYLISWTEFKRMYFDTALGYLWSLCRPLLLFAVLLEVFTHVVRLGSQVHHYSALLLFNIVLFGFFQEATNTGVVSVVSKEAIVRKTQFPRIVIPLAVVLTSIFNLALNLVVVLIFMLALGVPPMWTWLLFPIVLLLLVTITTALTMFLSSLYPRFRDLAIIWAVVSTALFYATPVLFPLSVLHGTFRALVELNPLSPIFGLARRWMIDPGAPVSYSATGVLVASGLYVVICVLGVWVFRREAPVIAEAL